MTFASNSDTPTPVMRRFWTAIIANTIWVNISEVFRYFAILRGMMQKAFPQIPNVADMNLPIFMVWGLWDQVLVFAVTGFSWLLLEKFGSGLKIKIGAATAVWATVFVLLWVGFLNMNLATMAIVLAMLPLAWFEMLVATFITAWAMRRV
jgi:hypothetical protein